MKKSKSIIEIILVFLSLLFTQYLISINIGSRSIFLYLVEILIILAFVITLFWYFFKKKKPQLDKKYFIFIAGFIIWFIILTVYRYSFFKDISGGFIIFRVIFLPVILAIMFYEYNFSKKSILYGILLFISLINIVQIYSLVFVNDSFRQLIGLKNINIYLCFALSILPILFLLEKEVLKNRKRIFKLIPIYFNILAIVIFTVFSGSRIAFIILPFVFSLSFFFNNRINLKTAIKYTMFLLTSALMIFLICKFNVYDAKYNLERSMSAFNIVDSQKDDEKNEYKETKEQENKEVDNKKEIDAIINNQENNNVDNNQNINIVDSNNMRMMLWRKSFSYIFQNPLFGKPSIDVDIEMTFEGQNDSVKITQSPHNFILELWLGLGLVGMLYYLIALFIGIIKILKRKIKLSSKLNFLLSIAIIYLFSFFQPLVTCYFVISILLVYIFCIYLEKED